MTRKINIAIWTILLIFVVGTAFAPNVETKKETKTENRLGNIEKKLDKLIVGSDSEDLEDKLDEISKQLDKIESLIRTRSK